MLGGVPQLKNRSLAVGQARRQLTRVPFRTKGMKRTSHGRSSRHDSRLLTCIGPEPKRGKTGGFPPRLHIWVGQRTCEARHDAVADPPNLAGVGLDNHVAHADLAVAYEQHLQHITSHHSTV